MNPTILKRVSRLKESAKTSRDFGELDLALTEVTEAIKLLLAELQDIDELEEQEQLYEFARELADCYGMAGGIYRRMGQLENALEMYHAGCALEQDERYNIQDSYNLLNTIVIPIMQDGNHLAQQRSRIEQALELVQHQVSGIRRDQWWAWADLGLLYLLSDREPEALRSYHKLQRVGARQKDYDCIIAVLIELQDSLQRSDSSVVHSVNEGIRFLREAKSQLP